MFDASLRSLSPDFQSSKTFSQSSSHVTNRIQSLPSSKIIKFQFLSLSVNSGGNHTPSLFHVNIRESVTSVFVNVFVNVATPSSDENPRKFQRIPIVSVNITSECRIHPIDKNRSTIQQTNISMRFLGEFITCLISSISPVPSVNRDNSTISTHSTLGIFVCVS